MSRTSRTLSFRTTATLAIASSLLVSGIGGASLAQAEPLSPVASLGSLDLGALDLGSAQHTVDAPRLVGIDNFRDVAGTGAGYSGSFGLHVNKGVFYRANAIRPKGDDMADIEKLGLTKVYDLRTAPEISAKPDVLPDGVAYEKVSILDEDVAGPGPSIEAALDLIKSPDDARKLMQDMNRGFVTGTKERAGFNRLLTAFAETDGSQVFHCTSGKDRTGWAAMLLLSIAGVDRTTIMNDYLLTNEYSAESIKATVSYISSTISPESAANIEPLLGVEANFLEAGLTQVEQSYGTVDRYLTDGLGLSQSTIAALKVKLLG
ncbi:UNVERIFIED_ORG: protein-tyrosine phosphatase [Nocardia globerula]|uniref:Protein-tyrosine phosphatase n=1 Tax=Nocardia globerula TaxID=1818 RepID=A0A652YSS1_NOCGL|nr:tyrosine-protein phosphatase [Rhodococcus globerulus]NMD61354.1 tyrosine-protein phosphatase [Nocardia globerula]PVX67094.1 protein-tyrosine phosphatase [Rhodococcus globerulus]